MNPYSEQHRMVLQYKESDYEVYENRRMQFDLKNMKENNVVGMAEGFFVQLVNPDWRDMDRPRDVVVAFEKQKGHQLKDTHYDNFALRRQIYHRAKSLMFMVFFPYIAINQTNLDLHLLMPGTPTNPKLLPFSSLFIKPNESKMQIKVDEYQRSNHFEINTFGVSGSIKLKKQRRKRRKEHFSNCVDPSLD